MKKLFKDSEVFQKERPIKITKQQKLKVFKEVANDILYWQLSTSTVDTIIEDLAEIYNRGTTGFEMAKDLDDGFNILGNYNLDSTLVEVLESVDCLMDDEKNINIEQWVKAHDIKPKFKIGDGFKLLKSPAFSFKDGDEVFITIINLKQAYYCLNNSKEGNGGTRVYFEELEECI